MLRTYDKGAAEGLRRRVVELSDFPPENVPPMPPRERQMKSSLDETDPADEGGSK
jgi:hypothetical protein